MKRTKIFTGNSNPALAQQIANNLKTPLSKATVGEFSDGEIEVIIEENVRGQVAVVIQSTSAPTNDNLMELLIVIDALRRSSVKTVIAVIPYYGYSRQDRQPEFTRSPITSRLVASMLETAGVDQVITVDIHSLQQQGFFTVPFTNVSASNEIIKDIKKTHQDIGDRRLVIVSPDVGGVARARYIAKRLNNADLAIIDKRREKANQSQVLNIIGNVEDAVCVMIDDMIDTAGTLSNAATALKDGGGAFSVFAYGTHAVLSGMATRNIRNSKLDQVIVTDTIELSTEAEILVVDGRLRQISVASVISETIKRIRSSKSVRQMYD